MNTKFLRFYNFFIIILLLAFALNSTAQDITISVQSENGNGVQSNIYYTLESDRSLVGLTDEDGYLLPDELCRNPQHIEAVPTNPAYLQSSVRCSIDSDTISIKVFNKLFTNRIVSAFENPANKGNHAFQAMLANELYVRYAVSDTAVAQAYEIRIIPAATEYLIDYNFLPANGEAIGAVQFDTAIRNLQQAQGLSVNGILDYETLSTAAGVDIGDVIRSEDFQLDQTQFQPDTENQ